MGTSRHAAFAFLLALLCLFSAMPSRAVEAAPLTADPALEARVMRVAEELRCLVCQNETIAASQADLANDLRKEIRTMLQRGESETQVLDFMVQRYGQFVRYRPAFNPTTALLWLGPFVLLGVASFVLAANLRRSRAAALPAELSEDDARLVSELLDHGVVR